MKVRTNVKAGGLWLPNHNETLLRVATPSEEKDPNGNEEMARPGWPIRLGSGLKVKTNVKAGAWYLKIKGIEGDS